MEIRHHLIAVRQKLWQLPLKIVFTALGLAVLLAAYAYLYIGDQQISFDYAGENCIDRYTFLPDVVQQANDSKFRISHQRFISISEFHLFSQQSCLQLEDPPQPGEERLLTTLYGNWLGRQVYQVNIPELPEINLDTLQEPVALTKAVKLPLSTQDHIFTYALHANKAVSKCQTIASMLECRLEPLNLKQGEKYEVTVVRYFNESEVAQIEEVETEILKAVTVTETSIAQDEVIYSKPQGVKIAFDKAIISADAVMHRLDEKEEVNIGLESLVKGQTLEISWKEELKRQSKYAVRVTNVEAEDGSTLAETYTLRYSTSGGPKVAGISIAKSGVPLHATAVISFDQSLLAGQDASTMVTVTGSQASVVQQGDTMLVKLINAPRCQNISIHINNGITSTHGISGSSAWEYNARTVCHSVEVIGHSVQGRPIYAYFFGNGSTTILYTGAIHGNELSSSYLTENWMDELEANYHAIPNSRQIVVVPEVNPDGVANGTRYNANGVDLNRNFAVSDWKADITDVKGSPLKNGGGAKPMSEPETKAIANLTKRLQPRLTLSYHSIGGVVLANQASNSVSSAIIYSQMSGYYHGTGQSSEIFDYAISGTYDDWIAEVLGLPSILIELGSHTYSQYPRNKEAMWKMATL